jgi:hypothetical protein
LLLVRTQLAIATTTAPQDTEPNATLDHSIPSYSAFIAALVVPLLHIKKSLSFTFKQLEQLLPYEGVHFLRVCDDVLCASASQYLDPRLETHTHTHTHTTLLIPLLLKLQISTVLAIPTQKTIANITSKYTKLANARLVELGQAPTENQGWRSFCDTVNIEQKVVSTITDFNGYVS